VLLGGLVAGTFDITFACTFWAIKIGARPTRIFQSVASGLLGPASFQGGGKTAALGLFLHYFIASTMSIVYYFAARAWSPLHKYPLRCGAVYGLGLWVVMNYVVLPLSAARPGSKDALWVALSILVHMFLIGVPIAWFTQRAIDRSR
jgi:hypothetical protein